LGFKPFLVPNGVMATQIARANTVMLWLNSEEKVDSASAGDPTELEGFDSHDPSTW
jgi:hypothetical protein